MTDDQLIVAAQKAREFAYAPYSNFSVGAALVTTEGRVYSGCNVEAATYSLTMCAERVAIFKAVSEGPLKISKIAVVANSEVPVTPCGCCRQLIWEFGHNTAVIMANLSGAIVKLAIAELFPYPFDSSFLA